MEISVYRRAPATIPDCCQQLDGHMYFSTKLRDGSIRAYRPLGCYKRWLADEVAVELRKWNRFSA